MVNNDKKKIIMVVEDEPEVADLYREVLEVEGFEVEKILTGNIAISRIKHILNGGEDVPSVVVLDLLLPDISGLAILEAIRKEPAFDNTFVAIFTNYQSESLKNSVEQMPKVKYLSKVDTNPIQLVDIIKENL